MKRLAIIPARGGSKRIPRKNVRLFRGYPMISYAIRAALRSELFDAVVVSTDDDEIADISVGLGALVPFRRPAALSDDYTGTMDVIRHALNWFSERNVSPDFACCIYATVPFLRESDLAAGLSLLETRDCSFAFSVTSFDFAIQRALRIDSRGRLDAIWPEYAQTRSQDLEPTYHDAGQFYWGSAAAFLDGSVLFSPASLPVLLPRWLVHDIDTEEDWRRAELAHEVLGRAGLL
jgi:pseudaminic acid cytidylyltransferase